MASQKIALTRLDQNKAEDFADDICKWIVLRNFNLFEFEIFKI